MLDKGDVQKVQGGAGLHDSFGKHIGFSVNAKFLVFIYSRVTFTFMHLADAFIQSDLQVQVTVSTFLSALAFPGNRTHDLGVANAMLYQLSYRKAVQAK